MKISSYRTQLACPSKLADPNREAIATMLANFVTLELQTDDGVIGIGYSGFVPVEMLAGLKATLDALTECAVGEDPRHIEAISAKLLALGGQGAPAGVVTSAVAAIDVALWDIRGKQLGMPLFRLLGGDSRRVPAYASGFLWREYDAAALVETSLELISSGFRAMKFRMGGHEDIFKEVHRMQALRSAVGERVALMVDINQGWDVSTSIRVGREMEACGLYWLEDPIDHQDYEGLARIAAALDTPIATGEYHYGIAPFAHMLQREAVDVVMVDLLRAGGITPWMKVAHMAEAWNRPVVSHLAPEILGHCVAAAPNGLIVEHMPWSLHLFEDCPRIDADDGCLALPEEPGLGLAFDEAAIRHLQP